MWSRQYCVNVVAAKKIVLRAAFTIEEQSCEHIVSAHRSEHPGKQRWRTLERARSKSMNPRECECRCLTSSIQ